MTIAGDRKRDQVPSGNPSEPEPAGFWNGRDSARLLAVAVVGLAALLRFVSLPDQPGLTFDEAANGFDIIDVLKGAHPIFFPANTGREPLFIYFQTLLAFFLGLTPFAMRLAGAFCGVATIPALYFAAIEMLRWRLSAGRARRAALLGTLLLATGYWHLLFSRYGLRAVSFPLFALLAIGFFWKGMRTDRYRDFALSGLFAGVAMYTYLSSRLFPLVVLPLAVAALAARPTRRRFAQLVTCAAVWLGLFAPLGAYLLRHPAEALLRTNGISIFAPENSGGQPLNALIRSLGEHLSVVSLAGTLPPAVGAFTRGPAFDALSGLLFWLGLAVALSRLVGLPRPKPAGADGKTRLAALPEAFLIVWGLVLVSPSVLSIDSPHYMRMLGAMPALALLMAVGADQLLEWGARFRARDLAVVVVAVLVGGSALLNGDAYFGRWVWTAKAHSQLMAEKVEAARLIAGWTDSNRVFLAPLYYQDNTVHFIARERWDRVQTFDPKSPPVPDNQATIYVFPAIDRDQPETLQKRLGAEAKLEELIGSDGQPLLRVVRLDATTAEQPGPAIATFANMIDLVSARIEPTRVKPGDEVRVYLTWRGRQKMTDDYTIFAHVRRGASETLAQRDVQPGMGRSPTGSWIPGDRVLDELPLAIPAGTAPGELRIVIGFYRVLTLDRLHVDVNGAAVAGDEVEIGRVTVAP